MIAVVTRRLDIRPLVVGIMSVVLLIAVVVSAAATMQKDVAEPISAPIQVSEDRAVSQVIQFINKATPCLTSDSGFTVTPLRDSNIKEVAHGTFVWHVYPSGLVAPQFIHSC